MVRVKIQKVSLNYILFLKKRKPETSFFSSFFRFSVVFLLFRGYILKSTRICNFHFSAAPCQPVSSPPESPP